MHMRPLIVFISVFAIVFSGCGKGGGGGDNRGSDGGGGESAEPTPLITDAEGNKQATARLGDQGIVTFLSEEDGLYIEYAAVEGDVGMVANPDTLVSINISPEGEASYFVFDPSGNTMPVSFTGMLPIDEGDYELTIDPLKEFESDMTTVQYNANPTVDPFGSFVGILVSISIGGILRGMAVGAVVSTFGNIVGGACSTVAPLYDDVCAVIVKVSTFLAGLVAPGFKLGTGAISLGAFGAAVGKKLWGELKKYACTEAGVAIGKAMNENNQGQIDALRTSFRKAVGQYHYLLWKLESDPPAEGRQALEDALVDLGVQLSTIGPQVREGYVEIYAVSGPKPSKDPSPHNRVISATKKLINAIKIYDINWTMTVSDDLAKGIYDIGNFRITTDLNATLTPSATTIRNMTGVKVAGSIADCIVNVWTKIEAEVSDGNAQLAASLEMPVFYQQTVNISLAATAALNKEYYDGAPIVLDCEFDEYEPNVTWGQALSSPVLGGGDAPVWLRDMTLCTVGGSPHEEDFYAYSMGAIEFQVQARARTPENEDFAVQYASGADEPICIELFYYGQTNEIIGNPPTPLFGACGTPNDLWTGSAGVARATGEQWSYIIAKVYAQNGAMDSVAYDFGFAE